MKLRSKFGKKSSSHRFEIPGDLIERLHCIESWTLTSIAGAG